MQLRTLAPVQWIALGLLGCSATGGGTIQTGGSASVGGSSVSNSSATGGQTATGGTTGSNSTTATGGSSGHVGGASSSNGGNVTGGKSSTGGTSSTGSVHTDVPTGGGGPLLTGGTSGNAGGTSSTGGSKAVGGTPNIGGSSTKGGTSSTGGSATVGGSSGTGGTAAAGGVSSAAGGSAGGGTSGTYYYGYLPVANSTNASIDSPSSWYTQYMKKFYVACSDGTGRIAKDGSTTTVSEGIGYGMLLAVGNDDHTTFDALWGYYKGHLDINGLMNWSVTDCGAVTPGSHDNFAAADGDEDTAMALVQADAKWSGYKTDASNLINLIKKYETSAGPPSYLLPGDAKNGWSAGTVDPSYFAPGYWHVWATYVNDSFWNQLATDAYTALAAYQKLTISNSTGLVPNWGTIQGQATDANYGYDACRTPWRVTTDYLWFQTAAAQTFLQGISAYVDGKNGIASVPFDKNSAFLGAFALSGMAVSQAKADTYLNAWLSTQMDDLEYFQGALRGLYLLVANHQFPKCI